VYGYFAQSDEEMKTNRKFEFSYQTTLKAKDKDFEEWFNFEL